MPSARYSFGATVCPELPTWRSSGSQPASQIGREAASSAPSAFGELLGQRQLVLLADAAADGDDARGLRQVDRLLRLAERRVGLLPDRRGVDGHRDRATPEPATAPRAALSALNAPAWTVTRYGASPSGTHVGGQLALEDQARERRPCRRRRSRPTTSAMSGRVERGRELRARNRARDTCAGTARRLAPGRRPAAPAPRRTRRRCTARVPGARR